MYVCMYGKLLIYQFQTLRLGISQLLKAQKGQAQVLFITHCCLVSCGAASRLLLLEPSALCSVLMEIFSYNFRCPTGMVHCSCYINHSFLRTCNISNSRPVMIVILQLYIRTFLIFLTFLLPTSSFSHHLWYPKQKWGTEVKISTRYSLMKFFCRAVTYSVYKKWRKPDLKKEAKSLFSMLSKLGNKLLLLLQGNSLYFPTLYVFQLFSPP